MLPTISSTRPYDGPLGKGTFSTDLQVLNKAEHDCLTRLELSFELQLDGAEEVNVGFCIAFIVDKTLTKAGGAKGGRRRRWITELLRDVYDESEVAKLMRALFNRGGARRPALRPFAAQLQGGRLCQLDTFIVEPQFRGGNGIGAMCLDSFHALLPRLGGRMAYSGTVVLSPGMPEICAADFPGVENLAAGKKLVQFYSRCGYQLYTGPKDDDDETRFIMGRTV
ncbi:hypothetical protein LTR36_002252 [Oleoguttula mirabilis]|uniref:N-acetyltransferase domain-containing protein n=1 Tax=Oleoguttula mirabilis TaxID=1507867 RepID=A0AAV9JKU0_9PEZI|nr:hypothetical protein LTR36_002252 [Oleoguttula mirabilis]